MVAPPFYNTLYGIGYRMLQVVKRGSSHILQHPLTAVFPLSLYVVQLAHTVVIGAEGIRK